MNLLTISQFKERKKDFLLLQTRLLAWPHSWWLPDFSLGTKRSKTTILFLSLHASWGMMCYYCFFFLSALLLLCLVDADLRIDFRTWSQSLDGREWLWLSSFSVPLSPWDSSSSLPINALASQNLPHLVDSVSSYPHTSLYYITSSISVALLCLLSPSLQFSNVPRHL